MDSALQQRAARRIRGAGLAAVALAVASVPSVACAFDIENVGDDTLTIDVTNTSALAYHFDNRNDFAEGAPPPATLVDDNYGEWLDRLNVQAHYGRFTLGLRLDSAVYFEARPTDQQLYDLAKEKSGPAATGLDVWNYVTSFKRELNTRFLHTVYPSKIYLGYTAPGFDLTIGDFYAQLGRGLVFSARKVDELSTDTTVRGAKVTFKKSSPSVQVTSTVFGGQMNPVRFDETSGRRLNGNGSPFFPGMPTGVDFTYYTFDEAGHAGYVTEAWRPGYLEDTVVGANAEVGPKWMQVGGNASWVFRKSYDREYLDCIAAGRGTACAGEAPVFDTTNQSRLHNRILTASGTLTFPKIGEFGEFYIEAAGQQLAMGRAIAKDALGGYKMLPDRTGYAIYFAGAIRGGPIAVNIDGKHYRSFFPLSANINASGASDPTFSAPEYDIVAYNQVPTAEPVYVEQLGQPNLCISGGRAKIDWRMSKPVSAYVWAGHYVSWSEIDPNNYDCDTDAKLRTNTWDAAAGGELILENGKSNIKAWAGVRNTDRSVPADNVNTGGPTDAFYREGYVRYDISKHLAGDFTLQAQGLHRHRYEPLLAAQSWNEGENYLALHWGPQKLPVKMSFIFGYEYLGRIGCTPDPTTTVCHYFSGGYQVKTTDADKWWGKVFDTVSVFVGQRRGAIRCVSGVCRQFPPFEGARLELVSRF